MTTPINISNRRELFLDDLLVHELKGDARRVFHQPVPREIVLTFDQPWEGNSIGMMRIFQDDDRYRMYYRASGYKVEDGKLEETLPNNLGYAESKDGVQWIRPNLARAEFDGSTDNNLLAPKIAFPFEDANPNRDASARYKAISIGADHRGENIGGGHSVYAWKSTDAVHWEPMQEEPIYDKRNRGLGDVPEAEVLTWLDSINAAFWSQAEQRYVFYYRVYTYEGKVQMPGWERPADYFQKRVRQVEKAVSDDFLNWERVGLVTWGDGFPTVEEQIYLNGIAQYCRAPHIGISMLGRYTDPGWTASHDQLPDLERRRLESTAEMRAGTGLTDTLLAWSRDGENFERCPETFLKPGPQRQGAWVYGDHWAINHLVETTTGFDGTVPELSLYCQEGYRVGPRVRLRRYSLRLDGFASIHADMAGGELVTPPFVFDGSQLSLNFATSAAGSVRVEILEVNAAPSPRAEEEKRGEGAASTLGYALDDCDPIIGDDVDRTVTWAGKSDLSALAGKPVRLRFVFKEADLYSLEFQAGSDRSD